MVACALLVLAALGLYLAAPWSIVDADNHGRPAEPPITPAPGRCGGAINLFAVGPPAATLSVRWDEARPGPPHATVLVLHGIHDRKESMLGWANRLVAAGYRVFRVDSRGHGHSSGDWLTYGVQESRDLSRLLDALDTCGLIVGPVGVMGVSYGAATAIEWAAIEPRVKAVVAVAPFASLREVVPLYFRRMFPRASRLVPSWLLNAVIARAGRLGGFDPDQASPRAAITRTHAPILLIHGRADRHIPLAHSEALHAAAPARSELVAIDGEDHLSITDDRTGGLWRATLRFLAANL